MALQRQDYLLRMITDLGQFVRAAVSSGEPGRQSEALQAVMHAQRQLFQEPPEVFLSLTLDEQIDHLSRGETPAGAIERINAYAEILDQAARVYEQGAKIALAQSSRHLGLSALLTAAIRWPEQRETLAPVIARMREPLSAEAYPPPLRELVDDYDGVQVP